MISLSNALAGLVNEATALVEPLQSRRRRRAPVLFVERDGQYEFYRNGRRGPTFVSGGDLNSFAQGRPPKEALTQPVEVRLDGRRMLNKVLQLPAASRNYLDAVVTHQLERTTPWKADRVVFDYVLAEGVEAGKDQIAVRLVATSREMFDAAMDRLRQAGIKPALVGTTDDPLDQPSPINLLQSSRSARRDALRRKVGMALLAIVVIGAGLSGWSGWRLYRLNAEATALNAGINEARGVIEAARARSEESETTARLMARKREATPIVVLLDQLSAMIPSNTYLTELALQGEELRIAGLSSDAPGLIGILEQADTLADVHFAAPTISGENGAQDRFEIVARMLPPGAAAQ
jgi:general secretion pathway protein L